MENAELPIHFICGMARGGTTWMSRCLNTHRDCASFGETLFWGRIYIEPTKDGEYDDASFNELIDRISEIQIAPSSDESSGSLKQETVERWHNELSNHLKALKVKTPKEVFKRMCQFVVEAENKIVAVEKTPHHINWLPRIAKNFPDSKYIVMVRDPYAFMKSYKFQGFQKGAEIRTIYEKLYHPIQASLVWRGYAKSILDVSKSFESKVMIIKNEELTNHEKEILLNVARFLELPVDQDFTSSLPSRSNSSIRGDDKLQLDSADYFWMNLIAKKEIKALGYELKKVNIDIFPVIFSIFKLPLWVFRTVVLLKNNSKGNIFKYVLRWLR